MASGYTLQVEEGWKDERVWCVTSDSGNIITRRRGSVTVMGNTEGFDAPASSMVAMARPTRSLTLYAQMLGRGLRPLPGVVDAFAEGTDEQRREAIAESAKPHCLVLDFEGTGAQFDLVSPVDLLAGNLPEAERKEAAEQMRRGAESVDEAVILAKRKKAQEEAEARRQRQEARRRREVRQGAEYVARDADYLGSLPAIYRQRIEGRRAKDGEEPASRSQAKFLYALHCQAKGEGHAKKMWQETQTWSMRQASKEIEHLKRLLGHAVKGVA